MASLVSMLKTLSPINSKAKVDKIVEILRERNTQIDYRIDGIVYEYLEDTELIEYYHEKKQGLKHCENISSWFISTLLAYMKPINSVIKLNKLKEEIKKYGYPLTLEDKKKIRRCITNVIVLKQWEIELETINDKQGVLNQSHSSIDTKKEKAVTNQRTESSFKYLLIRTTLDVDIIVAYFKTHKDKLTPVADRWIQLSIVKSALYVYYKDKMSKTFYYYSRISRKARTVNLGGLTKRMRTEVSSLREGIEKFRQNGGVDKKVSKQNGINKADSAFEVLKKREWILDWNCVMFKRGYIVIYARQDLGFKFSPTEVPVSKSIESFNYLKKYLNERLSPVRCEIVGLKLRILDKINFDEAIQQFSIAARQGIIKTKVNKIAIISSPKPMSFSQALSKAQKMTEEEFKKYKSKYIDYLITLQSKNYKVIPCVERLAHSNSDNTEYAFMFSIGCSSGRILIVHENVNPDRSTLLFLVREQDFNRSIREIYDFLQGAEINKRSSLRDRSIEIKNAGIVSYRSINHDDIYSWKQTINTYKQYR